MRGGLESSPSPSPTLNVSCPPLTAAASSPESAAATTASTTSLMLSSTKGLAASLEAVSSRG